MGDSVAVPEYILLLVFGALGFSLKALYDSIRESIKTAKIERGEGTERRHEICSVHLDFKQDLRDLKAEIQRIFDLMETHRQEHRREDK